MKYRTFSILAFAIVSAGAGTVLMLHWTSSDVREVEDLTHVSLEGQYVVTDRTTAEMISSEPKARQWLIESKNAVVVPKIAEGGTSLDSMFNDELNLIKPPKPIRGNHQTSVYVWRTKSGFVLFISAKTESGYISRLSLLMK